MKKKYHYFFFVLFITSNLILAKTSYSQWKVTGIISNPGLSPCISVADNNNFWCAGGNMGAPMITHTTNAGLTWTAVSTNGIFTKLFCIWTKDANTVFAGDAGINGKARFYKTTDAGLSWIVLDSIEGPTASFNGVKFSESMPLFGIAVSGNINGCESPNFIYKTKDGGNSWTKKELPGFPGAATMTSPVWRVIKL